MGTGRVETTMPFMLRVAGLPVDSVRRLRCPASRRWADDVLIETERLAVEGTRLGGLLHGLIGHNDDESSRRLLLAVRRAVFNNRLPRDADIALAQVRAQDPDTARMLERWLTDRRALDGRRAEGAALLARETARARAALGRLAGEPRLRGGLLLASPTLDAQLDDWQRRLAADPHRAPGKRDRKIERSLLAYLYRTACKTSPFSTFTGVVPGEFTMDGMAPGGTPAAGADLARRSGEGAARSSGGDPGRRSGEGAARWCGDDPAPCSGEGAAPYPVGRSAPRADAGPRPRGDDGPFPGAHDALAVRVDDEWTGRARLNVAALGRLAEAVTSDPARRADLPLALAPGWGRVGDRVRYVRRWTTSGEEDTAVTFDAVQDRLFFLRRSGTLERLIALLEDRGSLRHGELAAWLAADRGATAVEAEQYLTALLDIGMVQVPGLRTGVHDIDPLRAFQDSLRALGSDWASELAGRLGTPLARLDRFAAEAPRDRRELLDGLREDLRAVQTELGAARGRVPQTVLYEDVAAGRDVRLPLDLWTRSVAGALGAVERVLPAFDLTLPQRITFKGFFVARHGRGGRCDDLLKLVHDFHEDFFDQYISFTSRRTPFDSEGRYVPEENWLGLPQLKALDNARQTFAEGMRALWENHEGGGDLVVGETLLAEVAGELDPITPPFMPLSHHVQLAVPRGGEPLAVLNRSYGGVSFPFSRFAHGFEGLEERLLHRAGELCPEGAVLAEVTGGPVTSNLNLHGRLTEYEIVCPGESAGPPGPYGLHLDDLHLVHDETEDRLVLRSARLGREVVPVYLGYLVPLALPELPRTLLLLSPSSMSPLNVWGGVPESDPVGGVTRRPRVRHGGVVLSRRSWSAPASALPLHSGGATQEEWFLGWHAFRRAHGLPDRVFATVTDGGARGATGAKPQYVDLDSPLSLAAFEGTLRTSEARVVLREMLPDESGLHVSSARGRHVAELAVETTAVPTRPKGRR
ncbi:lantibiotic dehydratase [Streptomyces sp. WMMC940]|uniref:lantibiotic dehydratase n=1 Tax=Streptomyces sp. WMMC940 TaxID=3015153 RepID=UPI0022B6C784|nr:lantibiotic dehydratase [Streptomyces sp. WMMC940]MCZ7456593.1 lantibiotic dehydratase [Streptomyces sp. WMMC940]